MSIVTTLFISDIIHSHIEVIIGAREGRNKGLTILLKRGY